MAGDNLYQPSPDAPPNESEEDRQPAVSKIVVVEFCLLALGPVAEISSIQERLCHL
jgi:hypothetical protein